MLQSKTDNPLDGLHLETYVRADADGVASCAAGLLAARCAEAVSRRGVFTLALSGGSTPLTLFRLLRTEAWAARVDWAHTRVFWVDERCVAPDHPANNYGAANQELLAHVPAAEIYPMDGEIDPGESAVAYEELLRQHVPAEQGMPRLDCALLGMGDDGHTASLFPGSPLLAPEALRSGRLTGFAVAEHLAPKPESRRITLTLEMINAARCCLYLATGEGKRPPLGKALDLLACLFARAARAAEGWRADLGYGRSRLRWTAVEGGLRKGICPEAVGRDRFHVVPDSVGPMIDFI